MLGQLDCPFTIFQCSTHYSIYIAVKSEFIKNNSRVSLTGIKWYNISIFMIFISMYVLYFCFNDGTHQKPSQHCTMILESILYFDLIFQCFVHQFVWGCVELKGSVVALVWKFWRWFLSLGWNHHQNCIHYFIVGKNDFKFICLIIVTPLLHSMVFVQGSYTNRCQ